MPYPRKQEPVKCCAHCGKQLERKRYNGTLEDLGVFNRRKFCNQACMGTAKVKPVVTLGGLRTRAKKYRGNVCLRCGVTDGLQVHHLDSNPANNAPSNLMTLCGSCHTTWHWRHGKKPYKRQSVCRHCDQPARRWGMCQKHYQRFVKYGNPFLTKIRRGSQFVLVDEGRGQQGQDSSSTILSHCALSRPATARRNAPQS